MANPSIAEIAASRGAATGALSWAPAGTALPTDAITALIVAYKGLGYIGSDGIQPTRDINTDQVRDMNGKIVAVLQTEFGRTVQATLLQSTNVDVKNMIFGAANVVFTASTATVGALIAVQDKGIAPLHGVLVSDVFNGLAKHRDVYPDAQPTSVEIGPLVSTAVRRYTVTWTCFDDSAGVTAYEYDNNGIFP